MIDADPEIEATVALARIIFTAVWAVVSVSLLLGLAVASAAWHIPDALVALIGVPVGWGAYLALKVIWR